MKKEDVYGLTHLSTTQFITLKAKVKESNSTNPIIYDAKSIDIMKLLDGHLPFIHIDKYTQTGIAVRTYIINNLIDRYNKEGKFKKIINIGAGLDTRAFRYRDFIWYNIDLPKSISLRERLMTSNFNEVNLGADMFSESWIKAIGNTENSCIIIEGVLMYFEEDKVHDFLRMLGNNFHKSVIIFDTIPNYVKNRKHSSVDIEKTPFKWSNEDMSFFMNIHANFSSIESFFYSNYFRKKWGIIWLFMAKLIRGFDKGMKVVKIEIK